MVFYYLLNIIKLTKRFIKNNLLNLHMPEEILQKIKGVNNEIVLLNIGIEDYKKTIPEILEYLTNKKHIPGVYVSLNKPVTVLHDTFTKSNVNTEMIVFIDAISKMSNLSLKSCENCFYLRSPKDLSDISIAISEALKSINTKKKFVFFDSLNTLLLYSNENLVARFFHFLIGKIRIMGANGFIISLKKGVNKKLITELSQFCDYYIDM